MPASVVIADDHPLILKGLEDFLLEKDYEILAIAKNGKEAFNYIRSKEPDVAILDIQMPIYSGLEVAKMCVEQGFHTKLIIITLEKSAETYHNAKAIGVHGYILKEFALAEIELCIEKVLDNESYFSPDLLDVLEEKKGPKALKLLTDMERRVLLLTAQNKTAKEIGALLSSSDRTVEKHKSHIRSKLNLDSNPHSIFLFAKENEGYLQ